LGADSTKDLPSRQLACCADHDLLVSLPPSHHVQTGVNWMLTFRYLPILLLSGMLVAIPARADDIRDALTEAQKAYAAGDIAGAKQALDVASQLLAQKNADGLAKFLPAALTGWQADAAETDASAAAVFGGGLIAKRDYRRGSTEVTVQILSNSPMMMQMSAMFNNAQMLGSMGRVFRIRGKTAVLTREGTIQIVLGKAFVIIEGSGSEADKRAYLDALDLAAIEKFGT
jgi:hypothetical protein